MGKEIELHDYVICEGCEKKIIHKDAIVQHSEDDTYYFCKECLTDKT